MSHAPKHGTTCVFPPPGIRAHCAERHRHQHDREDSRRGCERLSGVADLRHAHHRHWPAPDGLARLSARGGFRRTKLRSWGLENVHREAWKFGRGWTLDKLTLEMVEPRYAPLIGYAEGWSPSTAGELTATPVYLGNKTAAEIELLKPSLKGAIVMPLPP